MADIRSMQPGGMAQKTKNSVSRFRSFTSMTAKLLVGAILVSTVAGCASTRLPRNIKSVTGIVKEEGYAESKNKNCVVGKTASGDREAVVYEKNAEYYDTYDVKDEGKVKKVKYEKKKKRFKVYHNGDSTNVPEEYKGTGVTPETPK